MIFDYLIDFRYLASALKVLEPGDPTLDNFKKIIDACVRPEENGRLVIDSDRHILRDLKILEFPPSRFGQQVRYIVEERFFKALPTTRFVGRQMIGIGRNDGHKICVRDIPVFERNINSIMRSLCSIYPPPSVIISEGEDRGDVACIALSDYGVFDAVDAVRGRLKSLQRVVLRGDHEGIPIVDFWSQLHTFGAAEETEFSIYDPYGFNTINAEEYDAEQRNAQKRNSLMKWIAHMIGCRNIQRKYLTVRICSKCCKNDYVDGIPADLVAQLRKLKLKIARAEQMPHLNDITLELKFLFAVDDNRVTRKFIRDVQHDRFICSSTHYFGIGSGIDSVGNREAFNVQYKGRIGHGVPNPVLEELSAFYDSSENLATGRIRTFTCQI